MRSALGGVWTRLSAMSGEATLERQITPPPDSPKLSLSALEAEAEAASRALTSLSAELRARAKALPNAVQPQHTQQSVHFADGPSLLASKEPDAELTLERPTPTPQKQYQEVLRAERDVSAFDALCSTLQEVFAAARAPTGAEGVSEFMALTLAEPDAASQGVTAGAGGDDGAVGVGCAAGTCATIESTLCARVGDAREALSKLLKRLDRQLLAASATSSTDPYVLRAAIGAAERALNAIRPLVDCIGAVGADAEGGICELAAALRPSGGGAGVEGAAVGPVVNALGLHLNATLASSGALLRTTECALQPLLAELLAGAEKTVATLPSPPSPVPTDPTGAAAAGELEAARAKLRGEGDALCELARHRSDEALARASSAAHCLLVCAQYAAARQRWPDLRPVELDATAR